MFFVGMALSLGEFFVVWGMLGVKFVIGKGCVGDERIYLCLREGCRLKK